MVLHVAASLVGFGAIALSGVYASTARHIERPGAMEESIRYFQARSMGEWALLAVPVLGVAAVATDPAGGGLGQAWIAIALTLWAVAVGVAAGMARPARSALRVALRSGAPRAAEPQAAGASATPTSEPGPALDVPALQAAATRLAIAAAVCDAAFVLAAIDMVLKPWGR
ncbi:hypothetical protein K6U06_08355 [Acidiferrimicrobium sp. IK]|uniref:hypothetical protein n=1 Tax=Acidiferrimicrobium sp. IK TaxID=2871700 RepID=UPI0021CB7822|nr:hypothetical protein [Acidiferrimicrobium sp. IK]MCU4184370.1 hypothetical protein [Acidiferrimicrobium sp. IK]